MKLEDQVCSLEQGKKLQELGVGQPALFKWQFTEFTTREGMDSTCWVVPDNYKPTSDATVFYPAYTVAELGEMLPPGQTLTGWVFHEKHTCAYYSDGNGLGMQPKAHKHTTYGDTEAQARAGMLIYLLENRLLEKGGEPK